MECSFKPGDKISCVNAEYFDGIGKTGLTLGAIYTVRELLPPSGMRSGLTGLIGPKFGVRLVEVEARRGTRGAFDSRRFRKVQKPKTDLSIESFLTIKPGFEEPRKTQSPIKTTEKTRA